MIRTSRSVEQTILAKWLPKFQNFGAFILALCIYMCCFKCLVFISILYNEHMKQFCAWLLEHTQKMLIRSDN